MNIPPIPPIPPERSSRAPQVWSRAGPYHEVSDAGYTVCKARVAGGWRYSAWGPDIAPGVHWSDWPPKVGGQVPVHYPRGVHVPRRWLDLGTVETAEQARALCEAHRAQSAESEVV